ncbi:hypothetical protein DYH09_12675 [bacterium CPR1]|nr:hypothetical protein [bacterium CPR1]
MPRSRFFLGLLAVIVAVAATSILKQGGPHRRPVPPPHDPPARVRSLGADRMELEAPSGWRKTVLLETGTHYRVGRTQVGREAVQVGSLVVVFDVEGGELPRALLVDLLPPPPPR